MRTAEASSVPGAHRAGPVFTTQAFGLELELPYDLAALPPRSASACTHRTRIIDAGRAAVDGVWRGAQAPDRVVDRRLARGRPMLRVEYEPRIGYRIWAPWHGRYLVSADGSTIDAAPPTGSDWGWQRLFFAQVLPLAATLAGLEPLHASAVARSGYAVAFAAASGTG